MKGQRRHIDFSRKLSGHIHFSRKLSGPHSKPFFCQNCLQWGRSNLVDPAEWPKICLLNRDFGSILSVFPRKNSKTESSLNFLQSGPRKFTKSDFSGLAPIRQVLTHVVLFDLAKLSRDDHDLKLYSRWHCVWRCRAQGPRQKGESNCQTSSIPRHPAPLVHTPPSGQHKNKA